MASPAFPYTSTNSRVILTNDTINYRMTSTDTDFAENIIISRDEYVDETTERTVRMRLVDASGIDLPSSGYILHLSTAGILSIPVAVADATIVNVGVISTITTNEIDAGLLTANTGFIETLSTSSISSVSVVATSLNVDFLSAGMGGGDIPDILSVTSLLADTISTGSLYTGNVNPSVSVNYIDHIQYVQVIKTSPYVFDNVMSFADLFIISPNTGNFTGGKTATATSFSGANNPGNGSDNNLATFFTSDSADMNPVWTIDLISGSKIANIVFNNDSNFSGQRAADCYVALFDTTSTMVLSSQLTSSTTQPFQYSSIVGRSTTLNTDNGFVSSLTTNAVTTTYLSTTILAATNITCNHSGSATLSINGGNPIWGNFSVMTNVTNNSIVFCQYTSTPNKVLSTLSLVATIAPPNVINVTGVGGQSFNWIVFN